MNHDGRRRPDDYHSGLQELELQIAVFAPGGGEAFVEAADGFERRAPAKAVRGDKLRSLQAGGIAFVIGGPLRKGHNGASAGRRDAVRTGFHAGCQPARVRNAIVVREGDKFSPGQPPTLVACRRRTVPSTHRAITNGHRGLSCKLLHLVLRCNAGRIVRNNHLNRGRIETLASQGGQTALEQVGPVKSRNHHGYDHFIPPPAFREGTSR